MAFSPGGMQRLIRGDSTVLINEVDAQHQRIPRCRIDGVELGHLLAPSSPVPGTGETPLQILTQS